MKNIANIKDAIISLIVDYRHYIVTGVIVLLLSTIGVLYYYYVQAMVESRGYVIENKELRKEFKKKEKEYLKQISSIDKDLKDLVKEKVFIESTLLSLEESLSIISRKNSVNYAKRKQAEDRIEYIRKIREDVIKKDYSAKDLDDKFTIFFRDY